MTQLLQAQTNVGLCAFQAEPAANAVLHAGVREATIQLVTHGDRAGCYAAIVRSTERQARILGLGRISIVATGERP